MLTTHISCSNASLINNLKSGIGNVICDGIKGA